MKNLLLMYKLWASKGNFVATIASFLSVIIIFIPFGIGIFLATSFIPNDTAYMLVDLLLILAFIGTYILFTTYINKL